MATDHRGNPINNNNLPKTTKDRMGQSDDDNNPTFEDEIARAFMTDEELALQDDDKY